MTLPQDSSQFDQQANPYAAPPVPPGVGVGVSRPAAVNAAFWIAMVVPALTIVLAVTGYVLNLSWRQELMADMRAQPVSSAIWGSVHAAEQFGMVVTTVVFVLAMIAYVIFTGLWALFGFKMRAGRHWARVTLTVFASLWIVFAIFGFLTGDIGTTGAATSTLPPGMKVDLTPPTGMMMVNYFQLGVGLIAMIIFIVLIFLPASNRFFTTAFPSS